MEWVAGLGYVAPTAKRPMRVVHLEAGRVRGRARPIHYTRGRPTQLEDHHQPATGTGRRTPARGGVDR